jgi:hypothetical protein
MTAARKSILKSATADLRRDLEYIKVPVKCFRNG